MDDGSGMNKIEIFSNPTGKQRWVTISDDVIKTTSTVKNWKRTTTRRIVEFCEVELDCGHWLRIDLATKKKNKGIWCIQCNFPNGILDKF